jgi:hypothetical protein
LVSRGAHAASIAGSSSKACSKATGSRRSSDLLRLGRARQLLRETSLSILEVALATAAAALEDAPVSRFRDRETQRPIVRSLKERCPACQESTLRRCRSPDGHRPVYSSDRGGKLDLWVRQLGTKTDTQLAHLPNAAVSSREPASEPPWYGPVRPDTLRGCAHRTRFPGEFLQEPLGVVAPGALADLLLIDGDPLQRPAPRPEGALLRCR